MSTKRERVLAKTGGHCGYCGAHLIGRWHMDHMEPLQRGRDDIGGANDESNLMAACPRCNLWKKTFSIEQFRQEIAMQCERLMRDSAAYRIAYDYGMIDELDRKPEFWFERLANNPQLPTSNKHG